MHRVLYIRVDVDEHSDVVVGPRFYNHGWTRARAHERFLSWVVEEGVAILLVVCKLEKI